MIPQVGGFQGCYLDNHRNNWRCARAVHALCENAPNVCDMVNSVQETSGVLSEDCWGCRMVQTAPVLEPCWRAAGESKQVVDCRYSHGDCR